MWFVITFRIIERVHIALIHYPLKYKDWNHQIDIVFHLYIVVIHGCDMGERRVYL